MIPFGEFLPDLPAYGSHATIARNVIPAASSIQGGTAYKSFPSTSVWSNALSSACLGAFATKGTSATPSNFAGDITKLYLLDSATWDDVSIGGGYTGATKWNFCVYGDRVIAVDIAHNPQSYVIGTSTLFGNLTTAFKSKYVSVVRDFVFHGYIDDAGTIKQNMVWWSAINDPTNYTPSVSTQCDNQLIYGEGEQGDITGVVGGEYATVFMEGGIHRFTFVGGDVIFTRDQIVYGAGCSAPGSIASYGGFIFYLGPDGFYLLNGTNVIPIGKNKVDKWFYTNLDQSQMDLIKSAIDPINSLYICAFPAQGSGGYCDTLLIYNWVTHKWAYCEPGDLEMIMLYQTANIDPDAAGTETLIGDVDLGTFAEVSLDSRVFVGGSVQLSAFDSSHKLVHFNASALEATIETGETQIFAPERALVTNVIPHVDGYSSMTVAIGTKETHDQEITWSDTSTVNSNGEANIFSNARYHRARVTIATGGFDNAYGVDFMATKVGRY